MKLNYNVILLCGLEDSLDLEWRRMSSTAL